MSRLKEPSTWASLAGMWMAAAQYIPVDILPKWCAVGMSVASAIAGVVLREAGGGWYSCKGRSANRKSTFSDRGQCQRASAGDL